MQQTEHRQVRLGLSSTIHSHTTLHHSASLTVGKKKINAVLNYQ